MPHEEPQSQVLIIYAPWHGDNSGKRGRKAEAQQLQKQPAAQAARRLWPDAVLPLLGCRVPCKRTGATQKQAAAKVVAHQGSRARPAHACQERDAIGGGKHCAGV